MKWSIIAGIILITASTLLADELPWPEVSKGRLSLPFNLHWFEEDAKSKIIGYGEPHCGNDRCSWMSGHPDGTIFLDQNYKKGTLVGFHMKYILIREKGMRYREKIRFLKEQLSKWSIHYPKDLFMGIVIPDSNFIAESSDMRIHVNYRVGEYSVEITLEMEAK